MLTPAFDLSQDPDFLTVAIRVPHARASEFDVYFEGVDFRFYARPYFLRLTLPGRIVENGNERGTYDADKGLFTIQLPKETPGQHFEGLNLLTALLAPRKCRRAKPLVEEIGTSEVSEEGVEGDAEEFDWEVEQVPCTETSESVLDPQCHYGFGALRSGVLSRLQGEFSEVIDVKDPDFTPAAERRQQRLAAELAKFDPDHYLADLFEDEEVEQVLKYNPWWNDAYSKMTASSGKSQEQEGPATLVSFSEGEKYQLRKFVNKSYLLDKGAHRQVYLGLVDILLAYCYETRVTEGDRNTWTHVNEILVSFGRRVLCYPLYRHFKLVTKACRDTIKILQLGKSAVLKCLLDIHRIFQENDPAYILNDLYISDYCVWIQKAKSRKLAALAGALEAESLTKAQLGLELEELEAAARLVREEDAALGADPPPSDPDPDLDPHLDPDPDSDSDPDSHSDSHSDSGSDSTSEPEDPAGPGPEEPREAGGAGAGARRGPCPGRSGDPAPCGAAARIEELGEQLMALQVSLPGTRDEPDPLRS